MVTNVPSGTLTLAGGSLVLTSNLLVGSVGISTGQVSIVGGSLSLVGSGNPGYLAVSSGTVILDQGNVTTDLLLLTNAPGQFVFNGGVLQAKNAVVSNGSPFVVGDGVHAATFQLLGGTYLFADGLVISNNASVTGCGTIVGTISNFGTLSTNCLSTTVMITKTAKNGSTATFQFNTLAGSNHVLEYKNTLTDSFWNAILPGIVGNGSITNISDPNATTPSRFYRIHVQ